jgi:hypothetical protein
MSKEKKEWNYTAMSSLSLPTLDEWNTSNWSRNIQPSDNVPRKSYIRNNRRAEDAEMRFMI